MEDFDLGSFLQQRANTEAGFDPAFDRSAYKKVGSLDLAGTEKVLDMQQVTRRKQQNIDFSLVGKVGLDPEGVAGQALNTAVSLGSGASRLVGNLTTLPIDALAQATQATVPDEAINAYSRVSTGKAQPGDQELLDQRVDSPASYGERMKSVTEMRNLGTRVADKFDFSEQVGTTQRDKLSDEIEFETRKGRKDILDATESFNQSEYLDALTKGSRGLARVIGNAIPAAASQPLAIGEYVAENTPQVTAAVFSGGLSTAGIGGYAFDTLREGYQDVPDAVKGAMPTDEERMRMGLYAGAAGLAEKVGDLGLAQGVKAVKHGVVDAAKGMVSGSARESATEGFQTYAEGEAKLAPASLESVIEGATIGAAVGGSFHAAGALGNSGGEATAKVGTNKATEEAFNKAVETGDVADLTKPTSAAYNPVRAVEALHQRSMSSDATSEVKEAAVKQADDIHTELNAQIDDLKQQEFIYSPEGQAQLAQAVEAKKADLATTTDPAAKANITEQIGFLETEIANGAKVTEADRTGVAKRITDLTEQVSKVREATDRIQSDTAPAAEQVDTMVAHVNSAAPEAQDSANKLLTLTMTNPDSITAEAALGMADNTSNNLTADQRTALRSFSEAKTAENALKSMPGVRADIATGSDGYKGIPEYRSAFRQAMQASQPEKAQAQIDQMRAFADSRVQKAAAMTAAYDQVKGTDNQIQLVNTPDGFVPTQTPMSSKELKANGGVLVSGKSFKLRDAVAAEGQVLSKTADALQATLAANPVQVAPVAELATPTETIAAPVEVAPVSEAPVVAEKATPVPVAETGEISAIKNALPGLEAGLPAEQYQTANLVSAFFKQDAGKAEDGSTRPLAAVKDFSSKVRTGEAKLNDFIAEKGAFTGPQQNALRRFFTFAREAQPMLERGFKQKGPEADLYRYKDYSQFLFNEDGTIDENVHTAISFSAFGWANDAAGSLVNTNAGINAILGRPSDAVVEPKAYEKLSRIGTRDRVAVSQLGSKIVQALGITALPTAPVNEMGRLETALGTHAMNLMIKMGIAERNEITSAQLQELMGTEEKVSEAKHFFLTPKAERVEGKLTAAPAIQRVRAATVGSQSVINKLFGVEAASVEPSYKPVPFTQSKAKRTDQDVPKVLAEILEKEGKRAHNLRQDMWQVWGNLSTNALYAASGVVDTTDTPTHVENLAGREAKNDGLRREVDSFAEFMKTMINDPSTNGAEQDLFFGRSVWKPQRVGLTANVINPQTSKVHRHMLSMPEWESTIDMNSTTDMNNFKLRVLEAFGVKTEAKRTADVLAGYDAKVNAPEVKAAVAALTEILQGEAKNNVVNEAAIMAGVKFGGENFHSLDALVGLATAEVARQAGTTSFKTTMMGEVDGVTNGPMLSLLMLGAKDFGTFNQGGFYELSSQFEQFNDYHAGAGNLDLYESTVAAVLSRIGTGPNQLLTAMEAITGELRDQAGNVSKKGRNIIKQPLTAMMFGSNTKTAVNDMADGFVSTIYSRFEDITQSKGNQTTEMASLVDSINALIKSENKNPAAQLDRTMSVERAMETRLTKPQITALKSAFDKLLGKHAQDSLNDTYATFLSRRDVINDTAQLAYSLYEAGYEAVKETVLAGQPNLPTRKDKGQDVALHDLTSQQAQVVADRLKDMAPVLGTAMSVASKQPSAGLSMTKTSRNLNDTVPYSSEMSFGEPVNYIDSKGQVQNVISAAGKGMVMNQEGPGVAGFITSIHSTDSAIASAVYTKMQALNVHDALGVGLNSVAKVGQGLNEATYQTLLNYSSASEVVGTIERVIAGVGQLMADPQIAAILGPRLEALQAERLVRNPKAGNFSDQLGYARNTATQADTAKLEIMANMRAVGQYATDGGSYKVTDADRKAALDKLAKVGSQFDTSVDVIAQAIDSGNPMPASISKKAVELNVGSVQTLAPATSLNTLERAKKGAKPELVEAIEAVQEAMIENNVPLAQAKEVLSPIDQAAVIDAVSSNTRTQRSVWGEIGTPIVPSDMTLVDMLSKTRDLTVHNLADFLVTHSASTLTRNDAAVIEALMSKVKAATKDSVAVVYVTAETGPGGAIGEGVNKSRGWYATQAGVGSVYVKSNEFVESGVTTEMLAHELVHSAVGSTIQRELDAKAKSKSYTSEAYELVSDLEQLRVKARELLSNNGAFSAQYANATSNVHELVSWGLTNQGFQADVLKKLTMPNLREKNSLLDGLRGFIDRVTGLLFRGSVKARDQRASTGLGLLVNHVSGLFAEAAKQYSATDTMTLKYEDQVNPANSMTTHEVFDALADASPVRTSAVHAEKLTGLLSTIVAGLHGPYGAFKANAAQNQAMTPVDVFLKAVDTGKLPFASKAMNSAFILNQQEAYVLEQVEATVSASLESGQTLFIRTSLENLYRDVRSQLNAKSFHNGDWATASQAEKDVAQEKYDFLFKPEKSVGNKSDYLSRFAALSLTSAEVSSVLQFGTSNVERQISELPWSQKLIEVFRRLVTKMGQLHDKTTPGQVAGIKLLTLVGQLVDIEAKRKARFAVNKLSLLDQTEMKLSAVGEAVRSGADSFGQSAFFRASSFALVRATGALVSTVAGDRVADVMNRIQLMRDDLVKGQQGVVAGLMSEMRGLNDTNRMVGELFSAAKQNEAARKQHIEYTAAQTVGAFKDGGAYLTDAAKGALTKVFLRTNAQVLADVHGIDGFKDLMESPAAQKTAREGLEQQLLAMPYGRYYIHAAKDLAFHKVVGGSVSANQMLNTGNIAKLFGTGRTAKASDVKTAVPVLDQLMSLYALDYTSKSVKDAAMEVFRTEHGRTDGNGVEMILKLHKGLQYESTEKLFKGTEALQISGYTPEIHNGQIEVLFISPKDTEYFQKRGYVVGGKTQVDSTTGAPNDLVLATRHGFGQTGLLTGSISYTGMSAKGSKVDRQVIDLMSKAAATSKQTVDMVKANKVAGIDAMFNSALSYDPRKAVGGKVVPVLNPVGDVVDYRYMMTEHNRDSLLERDNAVEQVLGTMAGQIVDKVTSATQNADVIGSMYDQYREDYASRPSSYLKVGKDSTDPQLAELYRLMPKQAQDAIRRIWKSDNMMIRADQMNMVMGYRKYSLTEAFGDPDERNIPEKMLKFVAEVVFGEKAALRIGQAEDVMQELVKEAKDILVVKNISTLVGNIISNMTLLAWEGVSLKDAVRSHAIGLKGAISYRADNKRLIQLTRAQEIGYIPQGTKAVEDEIVELKDRIARNPVKALIDAGLMPTIVEDVEMDDSNYSYKSRLARKVERFTNKVPKPLRDAGRFVYMTHDTSVYKFLSQTTQLSDFVARYTMYEHLISRAKDPMSKMEALQQAEESFVNYDIPSHRSLQFMNDMGILQFTKYYLRIQKTIMRLVREKPARGLVLAALNHYVAGAQTVMDSSWLHHLGNNPLTTGALMYPGTLSELPVVNGLLDIAK